MVTRVFHVQLPSMAPALNHIKDVAGSGGENLRTCAQNLIAVLSGWLKGTTVLTVLSDTVIVCLAASPSRKFALTTATNRALQSYAKATSHQSLFQDSTEVRCLKIVRCSNELRRSGSLRLEPSAYGVGQTARGILMQAMCPLVTSQCKNHMYRLSPS